MEVINELLGIPKIKIIQDKDISLFSVDSVLLAHFASIRRDTARIVDLGCGNAPIPLYLTQRTKASIIGVEIQEKVYLLAEKSVKINNMGKQIVIYNDDLVGIHKKIGRDYDLITCNPPFFKIHESATLNSNPYFTNARHELLVTFDQICQEASALLKNNGDFAFVHRPDRLAEIIVTLKKYKLEPKRIQFVYPKRDNKANHVLIEAKKTTSINGTKILKPLILNKRNGSYTKEILNIFNATEEKKCF